MDAEQFRAARLRLGWTQAEMAHYCDVTDKTISAWETGYRKIPHPRIFSDALRYIINHKTLIIPEQRKKKFKPRIGSKQATEIRRNGLNLSVKQLAAKHGVHISTIYAIRSNTTWKNL